MTQPLGFRALLSALRDSLAGAREATSSRSSSRSSSSITELTVNLEGTLYESADGLCLRLGRRPLRRQRVRQRVQIRMHGREPIITELSINGERL